MPTIDKVAKRMLNPIPTAQAAPAPLAVSSQPTTQPHQGSTKLPRYLDTPEKQASLPGWTDLFREYKPKGHPQARLALAATWDWAVRTVSGESAGLVLWSIDHYDDKGNRLGFGSGKTHLARAAKQFLDNAQLIGTFLNTDIMFEMIRATYDPQYHGGELPLFKDWSRSWLILDDVGKEHVKAESAEWRQNKYYRLLDKVLTNEKSIFITSNFSPAQIEAHIGGAAWSRLYGMVGDAGFIRMSEVPDYRASRVQAKGKKAATEFELKTPYKDSE